MGGRKREPIDNEMRGADLIVCLPAAGVSNARREDVVVLLKEQLARFEGQPEISGRA